MRNDLWTPAIAVLLMLTTAPPSVAEVIYPWCAQYGTRGGARNCGFTTWEQCRAAISGMGGYCIENPFYQRRADPPARYRSRRAPGSADLVPAAAVESKKPMKMSSVSIAARTDWPTRWCEFKGRRGDPKLFLSQQASGCFD
ncbi:MAG: DUF3551 domain-containing protein [Xanthobacteraceae bacterium]